MKGVGYEMVPWIRRLKIKNDKSDWQSARGVSVKRKKEEEDLFHILGIPPNPKGHEQKSVRVKVRERGF